VRLKRQGGLTTTIERIRDIHAFVHVAEIGKERHPAKSGHCLDQNFLPLAVKLEREDVDARCITVWPGLRGHQHRSKGEEIAAAIDAAKASGATALNVSASPLLFTHRQLIMERVAALRLPAIYEWPETAEEGGFAAYGPRLSQLFVEVMTQQLIRLFRGVKVADNAPTR
jgi:hypothetical protein